MPAQLRRTIEIVPTQPRFPDSRKRPSSGRLSCVWQGMGELRGEAGGDERALVGLSRLRRVVAWKCMPDYRAPHDQKTFVWRQPGRGFPARARRQTPSSALFDTAHIPVAPAPAPHIWRGHASALLMLLRALDQTQLGDE